MHSYYELFQSLELHGNVRIRKEKSKTIEYSPLHNEISLKQNDDIDVTVTAIKNGWKIFLRLKDDSVESIKNVLLENYSLLEAASPDEDNEPLEVTGNIEKDSRTFDYDSVDGAFLLSQWEITKNHTLPENMSIEGFTYQVEETEDLFYNSFGSAKKQQKNNCSYAIEYFYNIEGFSDVEARYRATAHLESISVNFLQETQNILVLRSKPTEATFSNGNYTIALDNKLVAEFLENVANSLNAENIRQRQSLFALTELNSCVFDDRFNLRNLPYFPGSAFNSYFDHEGITSEPITLIENGVIKNLFVDMKNSRKLSLPSVGNSSISNLVFETKAEASNPLQNATFLFTNLMAFHTVDTMTGKFALEGEGFEIIDGKKTGFVKNVALSSSVRELFNNIEGIGEDTFVDANVFCPTMSFRNQMVVI